MKGRMMGTPQAQHVAAPPFEPRQVTLKDGRDIKLRRATVDDAERILEYLDAMRREASSCIMLTPAQPLPPVKQQRERLSSHDAARGEILLLVEYGGEVVATLGTRVEDSPRLAHVIGIGMSSRQAFWGSGIGTAMMGALVDWCRSHPQILKLELDVFSDNERAIALYRKFGFVEEGRRSRHTQREPGEFVDDLVMGLWVGPNET